MRRSNDSSRAETMKICGGLEPEDLFKIYQHAKLKDDASLLYDLLSYSPDDGSPSREQYIEEYKEHARLNYENSLNFITKAIGTEVKTELEGDEAYIRPVQEEDGEWFFRVIRNGDGIWKVAWLAMQ